MDYEKIINDTILLNKLTFLQNSYDDCKDDNVRDKIANLISYYEHKNTPIKEVNKFETNIFDRLANVNKIAFIKPWNKLSKEQKKIKLNEYMNMFFINTISNVRQIKSRILSDFENNKLNSVKFVNYDVFSCQVIKINKLKYDKANKVYIY